MGNVAHDLKTPLHSIEADMELLILVISKIPKSAVDKAVASIQSSSCPQNLDLQFIFNTMNATCKFMVSSINRSQDFMKASNNIVLVPTLESFDLGAAMAVAVTCIKPLRYQKGLL
jgi:K+-sensing histidine kinase KdpD